MTALEDLPHEIVVNIVSYLNLQSRKNLRLVCKYLLNVNKDFALVKNDVFVIDEYADIQDYISPNVDHVVNLRIYMNASYEGTEDAQMQFWKMYGSGVKSLCLIPSVNYIEALHEIFNHCPNVEHFGLHSIGKFDLDEDVTFNVPNVLSLDFQGNLEGEVLEVFTKNMDNLEKLSVSRIYRPNFFREKIHPKRLKQNLCEKRNQWKVKLIKFENIDGLKELNFSSRIVRSTDELLLIIDTLSPQLTKLSLGSDVHHINDEVLFKIIEKCPNLRNIAFDCYLNFNCSNFGLNQLFSSLTQLTHVSLASTRSDFIRYVNLRSFMNLTPLGCLPNLTYLNLSYLCHLNSKDLFDIFCLNISTKITDLRLIGLELLTDDCLKVISCTLPNLQVLYLDGCDRITNDSLNTIFEHNQRLQCLSLENCTNIDYGLPLGLNILKDLKHLALFMSCNLYYENENYSEDPVNILLSFKLNDLCSLIVNHGLFEFLKSDGFKDIFLNFPSLKFVIDSNSNSGISRQLKEVVVGDRADPIWGGIPFYTIH